MARPPMMKKLYRLLGVDQVEQTPTDQQPTQAYRSMSDSETKKFIKDTHVSQTNSVRRVDHMQIPAMLEPVTRELIDRKTDHIKLNALAPEIEQAASILIPSILSPNDFRKNIFSVSIDSDNESDDIKAKVIDAIVDHFGDKMDISTKLSKWVNEAMFQAGSKSIMILPSKTIANIRDAYGSTETLNTSVTKLLTEISGSVESLSVRKDKTRSMISSEAIDNIGEYFKHVNVEDGSGKVYDYQLLAKSLESKMVDLANKFEDGDLLGFTKDPRILISNRFELSAATEAIDKNILAALGESTPNILKRDNENTDDDFKKNALFYYAPYIDLADFIKDNDASSYPAMIELPSESVIPIMVEGAPDNHIGYFVVLNENGTPVTVDNANRLGDIADTQSGTQKINNLYNAFYGTQYYSIQKRMAMDAKTEILNTIYDNYLRNVMQNKLDEIGLSKTKVNMVSDLSRVMFTRLLRGMKTRILYVPKKLMMYLAFDYHPDGTGKSKVDNIKFPLSLKITLIIVRLISLIESSINRRKLNITLDDSIGNPLEVLRTIKKEVMKNKLYGITYDPSTIIKSVLDKELTIVPNKIPGVEEFSITDEENSVNYPRPDDAILEEINNMYMLSLGVPPSAMNRLSEDEFSRSVAANNIFFSNQLKTYQNVICRFMTDFIRTYIAYSSKIANTVTDIIKADIGEDSENKMTVNARVKDIIGNISFTLPSPNLANDKSAFDDLREYIDIIDTVIEKLFPNEMTYDGDLGNAVQVLRWRIRFDIIHEHIKSNSILSDIDFDGLNNPNIVDIVKDTQKLKNLKTAIDTMLAKLTTEESEEFGGSTSETASTTEEGGEAGGEAGGEEESSWM